MKTIEILNCPCIAKNSESELKKSNFCNKSEYS